MMRPMSKSGRRVVLAGTALFIVSLPYVRQYVRDAGTPVQSGQVHPDEYDIQFGSAERRILFLTSVGCPFCMKWEREELPIFLRQYVNTGMVSLLMRDSPRDAGALHAAVFLTAFSDTGERLRMRAILGESSNRLYQGNDNSAAVSEGRRRISDTAFTERMARLYAEDINRLHIVGTPSFVAEGAPLLTGAYPASEVARLLLPDIIPDADKVRAP